MPFQQMLPGLNPVLSFNFVTNTSFHVHVNINVQVSLDPVEIYQATWVVRTICGVTIIIIVICFIFLKFKMIFYPRIR